MATSELRFAAKASLSPSELSDLSALVTEANWNQLAAGWRVFIEYGRLHVAHTAAGRIVATTAALSYGGRFAWISMVLVGGEYRRRGVATALLRQAMDELATARLTPVLDATPDGSAVYRRLGFEDSWGFHRLIRRERQRAPATPRPQATCVVRPISDADWRKVLAYDAAAFGAERGAVLAGLRGRLPAAELMAERDGNVAGFLLGRDGRLAQHIGPLIAEDEAVACALLYQNELDNWHLVTMLMSDEVSRSVALGWHDDKRMADDYRLVDEYLKMEKPYDVRTAYTNEFLDKNVKMPPIHPPKLF